MPPVIHILLHLKPRIHLRLWIAVAMAHVRHVRMVVPPVLGDDGRVEFFVGRGLRVLVREGGVSLERQWLGKARFPGSVVHLVDVV